jgi:hypothetical protein
MAKIDFGVNFKMLPGEPEPEGEQRKLGDVLAYALSRSDSNRDPLKLWNWAVKLATDCVLELDKSDRALLRDVVVTDKMLFVSSKGQLIELIDSVKE